MTTAGVRWLPVIALVAGVWGLGPSVSDAEPLIATTMTISTSHVTYPNDATVTVSVKSAAGTPTGDVHLTVDAGGGLTQHLLNGAATFTLPSPGAGTHTLSASYNQNGNLAGSTATGTLLVALGTPNAVLYEVSETIAADFHNNGLQFHDDSATLAGWVTPGTPLCPMEVAQALNTAGRCFLSVFGVGQADDATGIGPVQGKFSVTMHDDIAAATPEIVILKGTLQGMLDLSPAFHGTPVGSIVGTYQAQGVPNGPAQNVKIDHGIFSGIVRLPFFHGNHAYYVMDDRSLQGVTAEEFAVGFPSVRFELTIGQTAN
jgi:Bacterial Ig-like domain (group 3)